MTDWLILRCPGSSTLPLAKSLTDAGYGVWVPVEVRAVRKGKNREIVEQEMPILPEYVFADMRHLDDLFAASHTSGMIYRVWDSRLRRMVVRSYPKFSVFRPNGAIRAQTERDLAALRQLEAELELATLRRREDAKRNGPAPKFYAGQMVRVDGGGFEGLRLRVVEDNAGKVVKVTHPDWMWTVEISAFKIAGVHVSKGSSEQDDALAA